jgi:hypothetical protein
MSKLNDKPKISPRDLGRYQRAMAEKRAGAVADKHVAKLRRNGEATRAAIAAEWQRVFGEQLLVEQFLLRL